MPRAIDREKRFKRIAERRVAEVLRRIRMIGNLSNRSHYAYSDRQVSQMFSAIEGELKLTKTRFVTGHRSAADGFKFAE